VRTTRRRSVAFLVWRDRGNPEGGGSETYIERIAEYLAAEGAAVTICTAAYPGAERNEVRNGIQFRRRGSKHTVYLHGLRWLLSRAGRRTDVVVDVQNGLPFFAPLVRRKPVINLTHHVHREQWQIIYPGLLGRFGWWLESRVSPRVYRTRRYVTVSAASRTDLAALGIDPGRIELVYNGIDDPASLGPRAPRADRPTITVLGRLVPHKQVEHAFQVVAELRDEIADLHLDVVGDGWWRDRLVAAADAAGVTEFVTFHGTVGDAERDTLLEQSWLLLTPSIKEGWGLVIMEAAARGVPCIAYADAGGVTEAVVDSETGWLVTDLAELTKRTRELLTDHELRESMGRAAERRAGAFSWDVTGARFAELVARY
jgi:glycosyltransferase involved in cell wall biosynthesis